MAISAFAVRSKSPVVSAALLILFLGFASGPDAQASDAAAERAASQAPSLVELSSQWVDQDNKAFDWSAVSGPTTVVALVYTSCQMSCPLILRELQAIDGKLTDSERKVVRILLFSFDPVRDTVARLKEVATKDKLEPVRWTLLTGTDDGARELAIVLGAQFKKLQNGEFTHSNFITVLDSSGRIVHQQPELGPGKEQTVAAIRKTIPTR